MDRAELIERLRAQKAEAEKEWHDAGCEEGKRWAEDADYESLVRYAEMNREDFAYPAKEDAQDYWNSWHSDPESAPPSEHLTDCFWQGWLAGVKETYQSLEAEL